MSMTPDAQTKETFEVTLHCCFCSPDSTTRMSVDLGRRDVWLCKACNPPSSPGCKVRYAAWHRRPTSATYADHHLTRGAVYTIGSVKRWQHGTNVTLVETGNLSFDLLIFTPMNYEGQVKLF